MQANLSYISGSMQKGQYVFPGPSIMMCPYKQDSEINKLYADMPKYFGDWKGANLKNITSPKPGSQDMPRTQQMMQQQFHQQLHQQQQQQNMNPSPTPQNISA
jgi:hypothetical protein